jgi:ribosomal protein S7
MGEDVPVEVVTQALRRVRPSVYQMDHRAGRTTITLTVNASTAGRRNAAARIVAALAAGGLALVADDPIARLTDEGGHLVVRRAE